jgi:hypothetical protein
MEVAGVVWSEIAHNITSGAAVTISAYALATIGVLAANLGVVIGLAIEYGMIKRQFVIVSQTMRYAVVCFIFLMFSAIWLTASDAFMYLGASFGSSPLNSMAAFLLALIGTFVLVPSKKLEPRIGSGV